MSENIIRKCPPAVRSALGTFVGCKVREETHGDPERVSYDYAKRSLDSVVANRSRKGNFVVTVTSSRKGRGIDKHNLGGTVYSFDYPEEWRLVISESGRILSTSYEELPGWYDSYDF